MAPTLPSNDDIARVLDRVADLLEARNENPFRIFSYRKAARTVSELETPLAKRVRNEGMNVLRTIGGIGDKLAGLIQEYVDLGSVKLLKDLEADARAGPAVPESRAEKSKKAAPEKKRTDLPVDVILGVDEEYRTKAKAGKLKMIAPKKFNPEGRAWLPLYSVAHGGWRFTVMFSNTARAHELDKTDDWVVVYYERGSGENQCTVVTEQKGVLKGKRVVRGREKECQEFYIIKS
jgi:DNA polymerase (family 10)